MFDLNAVQEMAFANGLNDLVNFVKEERDAYVNFIMRGDKKSN